MAIAYKDLAYVVVAVVVALVCPAALAAGFTDAICQRLWLLHI